jgi:cysteinyl-tRNA synthetase
MDSARTGLRRLLERLTSARSAEATDLGRDARAHLDAFDDAICDDLNTARALAVVAAASRDDALTSGELTSLARVFEDVLAIGLTDLSAADHDLKRADITTTDADVDALFAERQKARNNRDFSRSDELRDHLASLGVIIEDHADGTSSWRWT